MSYEFTIEYLCIGTNEWSIRFLYALFSTPNLSDQTKQQKSLFVGDVFMNNLDIIR